MDSLGKRLNPNQVNLAVDVAIFIAFLVAMAPRFSGLAIHEWLSVAFGMAIVVHLLLHWQWIVTVTKGFFGNVRWMARLNYLLNGLLFIAMTIVMVSGILISEIVLPTFGVEMVGAMVWRRVHTMAADGAVLLVGLHLALHWQWVVNAVKRYGWLPMGRKRATPRAVPSEEGQ